MSVSEAIAVRPRAPWRIWHRARFLAACDHGAETQWQQALLNLLLQQDGSTTRLIEALAGEQLSVHVIDQDVVHALPGALADCLPGASFLRRIVSLHLQGQVLLDSISYIAVDVLPSFVVDGLQTGGTPIGRLLAGLCTRRTFRHDDRDLFDELWGAVGAADAGASRSFCIHTPDGPCMIVGETFRQGLLSLHNR